MNSRPLVPWHDTPMCPCGGPMVGRRVARWNHRAELAHRLVCCACGEGRIGTDEEVAQAERADAAWEARS